MTSKEAKSCICTIEMLRRLAYNIHGVMDVIDADNCEKIIKSLEQEPKTGHCKDCKYFEFDSVAKVDGIPLIVAHEICSRWGGGCKTKEDGYCFLFEPKESEVSE